MRVDLSPRFGGHTVANQPPPHYCPPLIHLHPFPPYNYLPPERCKVSQQVWNSHELKLNLRFTLLCDLDYITRSQRLLALVG